MSQYTEFLKQKITLAPQGGFEVRPDEVAVALKPHQRDSVIWAAAGGRRLLAHRFGLGKTVVQLELGRLALKHVCENQNDLRWAGKLFKVLFVIPLGVRQEFVRDADVLLGWADTLQYITHQEDAETSKSPYFLTNYERVRDGDIDPNRFCCVCMDEAAVMRSIGSKSYQVFREKVKRVPCLFMATATPDPNGYDEILNYAHLLGVMDRGQALTRFFKRDSAKAGNLTLHPAQENEFWLWISSWAMFLSSPADLGYDATGYDLPPLEVRWHEVEGDGAPVIDRDGQMMLERDLGDLSEAASERKGSLVRRVAAAKAIVDSDPDAHFILWHDLEDERREILRVLPETVDIYGAMDYDEREKRVIAFSEGECRLFATKKSLSGSGCNFQRHCHRAIFIGIDDKFESFIQAIHRIYRFLQTERVIIDIIITPAQRSTKARLLKKWEAHDRQQAEMTGLIRKYGLGAAGMAKRLERQIGVKRVEVNGSHRLWARQEDGAKVILWTCRRDELLANAVAWCAEQNIQLDAVNESLPEWLELFGGSDPRKIGATEYWDDRAVSCAPGAMAPLPCAVGETIWFVDAVDCMDCPEVVRCLGVPMTADGPDYSVCPVDVREVLVESLCYEADADGETLIVNDAHVFSPEEYGDIYHTRDAALARLAADAGKGAGA